MKMLCKSQKDKLGGISITFPCTSSYMKIVRHVPEEFEGDMDNGDICSGRWIAWYPQVDSQSFSVSICHSLLYSLLHSSLSLGEGSYICTHMHTVEV